MLRIDRNTLPDIPRPVYEFVAEACSRDQVRIAVLALTFARWTELPRSDLTATELTVHRWLLALTNELDDQQEKWASAASAAAAKIAQWCFSEGYDADLNAMPR